ncbi:EamA family transporter [Cognatiyoonia sp. IB215182]|uniref:EamA family transporter n=1 Tax=Cognatiyoonia sp. IB215182 TaxID=3097353 RepID=UPI002A108172|nr:EamA family transporter [Cognatiyoonia sp. IB215182]MDX8354780.1 EamA family transporter [Cognatiyoonia sp. IB215182]
MESWLIWALLAAVFAALTAIFGKVGVEGVHPDLATLIRTCVILGFAALIVAAQGAWTGLAQITGRTWTFLVLSGMATGASWLAYFRALQLGQAAQVAPIDKLSVVLVAVFAAVFLGEKLSLTNWIGVACIATGAWLVSRSA